MYSSSCLVFKYILLRVTWKINIFRFPYALILFLNKKAREAKDTTTLHNYGLEFCYSWIFLRLVVTGATKREVVALEKPPWKQHLVLPTFFPVELYFQKLSCLKEGSCLATKHNCHLSQPKELELKMSVGRGGGGGRVQPFLSSKIVYLNSLPKPQGKVEAM